jgi:glycosyltransferase involved in cell wall biosynthesis
MLGAILAGIPCITHQRGINDHYSSMDHRLGESLAAVICISEAVRCNLIDHGFDSDRLSIIYNGLDPESLSIKRSPSTLRRQLQIDADQPVIGIVGNIKEWKGQMVVARAVKRLLDRYQGLVCLFVGDTAAADSCYEKKLKTFISENRMQDNIFFTGYQNNVADWINLMDVMIHASVKPEPFGRVFLEAMAMKKPVIGSAAGAVPEIIEHGVTGLLYPPGDDDKLAEAILSLLENSQLGRDMSEAGYKRLQKLFHVRKNVLLTTELYQKLLV